MSKNKDIISVGKSGMNRDVHPSNLKENEYSFAINANVEDSSGNGIPMLQNEPSNILCSKFKEGYKYLAHVVSINKDITYFFLTNTDTKHSEIGYIKNVNYVKSKDEIEINCGCNTHIDLGEPLENIIQPELCQYETIISDDCNNCLNFSIYHPIKDVLLKEEKGKTTLYWTDNYNPPRYIELHELDKYKVNSSTACGAEGTPTCLDCSKLLIFKPFLPFVVTPMSIENGGQLKRGTYEVLGAYCDKQGNEISNYGLISNPVSIFDKNNNELSQENLADITNFSIKLNVEGIDDKNYDYYKIAVIQKADIDGAVSYWFNGIYPTSNKEIHISTDKDKERTTLTHLLAYKPFYERTEGMSSSNGYMFQYGLTARKEVNLQPIANLLGGFLRWSTTVAKEELYDDGIASSKYKGYMRGEVYPFSIRFNFDNGYKTAPFLLINRPPTTDELEVVDTTDTQSVLKYSPHCNINNRNHRWQYYDTSSVLGYCQNNYDNLMDCNLHPENCVIRVVEQMCEIDYVGESGAGTLELKILDNYTNLADYIDDHRDDICDTNSEYYNAVLCGYISNTYPNQHCNPVFGDTCDTPVLDDTKTEIYLTDIINESTTLVWKTLSQYNRIPIPRNCSFYVAPVDSNFIYDYDDTFVKNFVSGAFQITQCNNNAYQPTIFRYMDNFLGNDTCNYALSLGFYTPGTQGYGMYSRYYGDKDINKLLLTNTNATSVSLGNDFNFYNKIHKNANWVKGEFPNNEDIILFEVSKINKKKDSLFGCSDEPTLYLADNYNWQARYTIYSHCGGTPVYTGTFDMRDGLLIELDRNVLNSSEFYIAIDTPIHTENGAFIDDNNPPKYFLYPSSGCYAPILRHKELDKVIISYDTLKFGKREYYYSDCRYSIPQVKDCEPVPYEKGKFGYYESIITYPDNDELYNSKTLNISVNDLPSEYVSEFVEYYVDSENEGNYILKDLADFRCKPIRHYKFPTNRVSPFMTTDILDGFSNSLIYPIGVSLDRNIVNSFLDIAVNNNLLTQSERDHIIGYEILRGDRVINKSVLAKGLLFDIYKYQENNDEIYYPNYPFNDLGKDKLNYNNKYRDTLTPHPFNSDKNNRYTFISPDIYFGSISSFNEVDLEGYMYGQSRGVFSEVDGHSKYVLLSSGAYRLAGLLALGEVALEWGILMGQATIEAAKTQWEIIGVSTSINVGAFTSTAALISLGILEIFESALKYGKYRYEWLKIIKEYGQPKNFASYYTGVGHYNYFQGNNEEDNYLRGVSGSKFLKEGRYAISEYNTSDRIFFNNVDREESMYISFGDFYFEYSDRYKNYDNSNNGSLGSRFRARDRGCSVANITQEYIANVSSPYVSIKSYIFDQYGEVDSVKWLTTGKVVYLDNQEVGKDKPCDIVYGGDIYISRFAIKRKVPFFLANAVDLADLTPFNYIDYRNLGSPRYYINYEISDSYNKGSYIFPTIKSSYNLDCERKGYFYIENPSRFYLYYYGFPYFLVESEINNNFRYSGHKLKDKFYPSFNDYVKLTQEKQVSIKDRERFLYNFTYSKTVTRDGSYLLPSTYSKSKYDTLYDSPNGVIYSNQDNSEQDLIDPWLVYKPYNYYQFNTKYGKLVSLEDIESGQVLARFSNTFAIFNAIDVLRERLTKYNSELGNGGIFAQRPITFKQADLGYAGTQHHAFVRTPFGHFWADAQRGEVIMVNSNGKGLKDIVGGMSNWFKEHLPFMILRGGIKDLTSLDLDNNPLGIGIAMVWDNRYSRLLITKRDYIVKEEYKGKLIYENGIIYDTDSEGNKNNIVSFNDNNIFKDVSWTIGYSLKLGRWLSYYSYIPDYYIGYQSYFKSGKNFSSDTSENGLWSHLLTNKSYQVFYGKKYPFIVELPYKEEYANKVLHSVRYWLDSRKYHNDYDFAEKRDIGFNKAIVYNNSNNSGLLNLVVEQKNNLYQKTQYPKVNTGSMDILVTENDKKWTFNHFYNLVRDEYNNNPIWKRDENNIMKNINISSLNYKNVWKDRIRGDWFLVRLIQDKESRFKVIFKWLEGKENIYR